MIDDDPDDIYLLTEMLRQSKRKQFQVSHCHNLNEAAQRLQDGNTDVVLLDLGLGLTQGLATLENFLALGSAVPVVVFTGVNDERIGEQAIKLGAEDYIPKNEASLTLLTRAISYAIERYALVEQLERRANEDPLTGLSNRHALLNQTSGLINSLERSGSTLAVALLDLDEFKEINDRYGHHAGDQVIMAFASRLKAHLRCSDMVARIGGDEFVWVLTNYDSPHSLVDVIEKKRLQLIQPVQLEELTQPCELIKVSVGVAEWHPGLDLKALLSRADQAMYRSKHGGADDIVIY